jgi:uncharacterized protein (TIGR02246 family)
VIEIEADFAAPPDQVFSRWTNAAALSRWFAPPGYTTVRAAADARPGGGWSLTYRSEDGHEYTEQGVFRDVEPPGRLTLTLIQLDGAHANPQTIVTVLLDDIGTPAAPRTRMRFSQAGYESAGLRDDNAQGWQSCFASLRADLGATDQTSAGPERELRAIFARWFDASARKDLDASMEPIADDIVSFEHGTPQAYHGIDAVRAVCAEGFEYQDGDFRWDVPDLRVLVNGDLAVTWGLNRMHSLLPDGTVREMWSRGTRIFQRRNGRWQMTHQHVSFPVDSAGQAWTHR